MSLQPADILIWKVDPSAGLVDRLIGWGERVIKERAPQGNQFYHVAFVSPYPGQMYSSQPPKIDRYPIPSPLPANVEVYRLKVAPTADQLAAIFTYAESRRGRWYPFLGVLTAGWLQGNLEFCSQFTEDAYAAGGVVLSEDIRFSSPDDIASSSRLEACDGEFGN